MKFSNRLSTVLITTIFATITACSHGPTVQEYPATASARDEVTKFDSDMKTAAANQLDVLSPSNFKDAQSALQDAKKSLDKQRDAKDTLRAVALGRAYLERSNEVARVAEANIQDVIVARKLALQAGAPNSNSKEFRKTDEKLTDVTSDMEKGDVSGAMKARAGLQLTYLDLELKSIKQSNLGQAHDLITQAEKEGAKNFAPRSLAIAQRSVQDTDNFITGNRHDTGQISTRSGQALKSANHLLKITRDAKAGKKVSAEDMALQMESEQNKVAEQKGQLAAQVTQISGKDSELAIKKIELDRGETAIKSLAAENLNNQNNLAREENANQALSADNAKKQNAIDQGQSENQALLAQNSNLSSEQGLNQRFEEARTLFTKNEAEVYKQGNTLMIRLRGLEFPASQAVLKGSNFPLLAKVQKVIKNFGKSSVTVEGHTDSSGGKTLNEKLSSERAEAVKEYLASNSEGSVSKIEAVGYGYQKPLATNKTPAGRAQNRRVDIVVEPETN